MHTVLCLTKQWRTFRLSFFGRIFRQKRVKMMGFQGDLKKISKLKSEVRKSKI